MLGSWPAVSSNATCAVYGIEGIKELLQLRNWKR